MSVYEKVLSMFLTYNHLEPFPFHRCIDTPHENIERGMLKGSNCFHIQ